MQRLFMGNGTHFVNFPDTYAGMMQIKAFRKSHPQFKGRRILPIFQLMPDVIQCGKVYGITPRNHAAISFNQIGR